MKKTICIILATAIAATLQAAIPLDWSVETTRAQPAAFDCYRGETLTLRASLYNAGSALDVSGAGASLYWQTNGMGEVYWSAPATAASNVLSATWAPTNDVGAASYNCFLGVAGEIYRAAFRIRMLPSPGAVPSELDLPAKSIDFATVTVINPPYYTQGEVDSALSAAAQSATNYTDSAIAFEAGAATNYADSVAQSATNYTDSTAARLRDAIAGKADATNIYTKAEMDAAMNGMQRDIVHYGQLAENAVSSVNGKTGNAVTLDAKDIDILMVKGNMTTNIEYAVNSLDIEMGMTFDAVSRRFEETQEKLPYPTNAIPYAAISGKPTIPVVPTNISAFVNDAGYLTGYTETDPVWTAEKGGYATTSALEEKADDNAVVKLMDDQTIDGFKTFSERLDLNDGLMIYMPDPYLTLADSGNPATLTIKKGEYDEWGFECFQYYDTYFVALPSTSGTIALESTVAAAAQAATNYTDSTAAILRNSISAKQDTISDLAAIREGAALGATALQSYTETDPTVPAWAKAASKPAYTYAEITGKPTLATVATSGSYNDLTDKPTIPSPTAPVASATLAWQSNGSAIVVSVGAAGTLSATLTGWIEGQTQTTLITIAAGASVSSEVKLVGYGTWPTGGQFLASATRVGNNVYVTPIVLVN